MERVEVTLRDIDAALPIVREVGLHTPTVPFSGDDEDVWLKLENLQRLGAFKIRGVWNRISQLTDAERRLGVSTISSGNHGLAVAWAARRLGIPCTVRVPEGAVGRKVEAIRAQGAEVSPLSRSDLIDAHERETWRSWPSAFLHPFAHPATIAGQGTIGREIAEEDSFQESERPSKDSCLGPRCSGSRRKAPRPFRCPCGPANPIGSIARKRSPTASGSG